MPRKFYCKMQIGEFAIGFCHSKKMYNVTIFFCDLTNVRSKLLLLGHLPNLVGHCPMSDSNLQPCLGHNVFYSIYCSSCSHDIRLSNCSYWSQDITLARSHGSFPITTAICLPCNKTLTQTSSGKVDDGQSS